MTEIKPVAWMYVNFDGECEQIEYGPVPSDDPNLTPLYAAPDIAGLVELVREMSNQFRVYEQMHLTKGTQDGDEKACRNQMWADRGFAALAKFRSE
jgi:hypothetical protein